eukprot:CAMPEP_0195077398 /NCGR_PEP_ID=MMETSP0448-20130528/19828_1 /TAXON_ID=66468 /ORGANISM="Heterocapsa triquestra, Strain CCMP 448" /LENGTH=228 /DNA_ID=CAMNT_0040110029 /DNA_START=37 /DNA_END=723 /DNA_ORIENTATION=+
MVTMALPWRLVALTASAAAMCLVAFGGAAYFGAEQLGPGVRRGYANARRLGIGGWTDYKSYDDLMGSANEDRAVFAPGVRNIPMTGEMVTPAPFMPMDAPPLQSSSKGFQICRNAALPSGGCCQQILAPCCNAFSQNNQSHKFRMCFNPYTQMLRCTGCDNGDFALMLGVSRMTKIAWRGRLQDAPASNSLLGTDRRSRVDDFTIYRFMNDQTRVDGAPAIELPQGGA